MVGFSKMMGVDEAGTLTALKDVRANLIEPSVSTYRGRIVKSIGDGFLIEYASVVDAFQCWLEIQDGLQARNDSAPEDKQIKFRVGVNVGDVIADGDDLFGDGVNIASRLETIAAPGGICVSHAAVEQLRGKVAVEFEDLGERSLKNIDRPVHAFRLARAGGGGADAAGDAGSAAARYFPDRPSVAILPFRNLNADPDHDFIADGISLGIQTQLVQLPGLFLINAVSHKTYRDQTSTVEQALEGLPVRYALEGTVQRAGMRVRVTAQLTDLHDRSVVWADRYDRDLEDVFGLQDDITRQIIFALNVQLVRPDLERVLTADLAGDGAWELFLRGVSHIYKFTAEDNRRARELFAQLHELRPDKCLGASYSALAHWLDMMRGWSDDVAESQRQAAHWAGIAMDYEENDGLGYVVMGSVRLHEAKYDEALALCEESVRFRTSCPAALGQAAGVQLFCGYPEKAIKRARESLGVRTAFPPVTINLLASAYRDAGELELSIAAAREAARLDQDHTDALVTLCSDYALTGETEEAERVAGQIMALDPGFSIAAFARKQPYRDGAALARVTGALESAGLPG